MENRIDHYRKQMGLTIAQLAEKMGDPVGSVSKVRRGERDLSPKWLKKFADALDCYPSELLPMDWQAPVADMSGSGDTKRSKQIDLNHVAIDAILFASDSSRKDSVNISGINLYDLQEQVVKKMQSAGRKTLTNDEALWLVGGLARNMKRNKKK